MADFITYEYNGKCIEFLMRDDLLINATAMAAAFGKRPVDFLALKTTKALIAAMQKRAIGDNCCEDSSQQLFGNADFPPEKVVLSENGSPILITIRLKEHGGTWMHRWLAIDFAMWLDVDFKLWVLERIDYLFISFAQSNRKLVMREQELINKRNKILDKNVDNPDIIALAETIDELNGLRNKKSENTRKTYKNWRRNQ